MAQIEMMKGTETERTERCLFLLQRIRIFVRDPPQIDYLKRLRIRNEGKTSPADSYQSTTRSRGALSFQFVPYPCVLELSLQNKLREYRALYYSQKLPPLQFEFEENIYGKCVYFFKRPSLCTSPVGAALHANYMPGKSTFFIFLSISFLYILFRTNYN